MSASDSLSPRQFTRDKVPVSGYDPEQMGPDDPKARFSLEHYDLTKIPDLSPASGAEHDQASNINDGYYSAMEKAVRKGKTPPIVVTEHSHGPELHDGWHRGAIALHHGITTLPAYVHRPNA